MAQEAPQDVESVLTPEVKAMIGVAGEVIEAWGTVDVEYLRRFTQAVMDPDPRYWDEDFAKSTHYGAIIVPPIMVSYMTQRIRPDAEDAITKAFEENPMSDGIGSVRRPGELPGDSHSPRADSERRQRDRDLPVPQHWGRNLLPEPLPRHPGKSGARRQGFLDHHP